MKLIIPLIILVIGAVVGLVVNTLLNGREDATDVAPYSSMIAGGVGAFAGMFTRDAMNFNMLGNLADTGIASVVGAAVFATVAHIILRTRR